MMLAMAFESIGINIPIVTNRPRQMGIPHDRLLALQKVLNELEVEYKEDTTDTALLIQQHSDALMAIVHSSTDMSKQNRSIIINLCFSKIKRNELCPCGSNLKYKKCCNETD